MNEPNNKTEISIESSVFDYVAGNMSDAAKGLFEQSLAQDPTLQDLVTQERSLRKRLMQFDLDNRNSTSMEDEGLDKLLAKIDDSEPIKPDHNHLKKIVGFSAIMMSTIAAIAVILTIAPRQSSSDFDLLSDQSDAKQIEFNTMVATNQVAQIWLETAFPADEIPALFSDYALTPIGRAGRAWVVISGQPLTPEKVSILKSVKEFTQVSLISYAEQ